MVGKFGDVIHLAVTAGGRDEAIVLVFRQGRQVLVADDLADADDAYLDGLGHGRSVCLMMVMASYQNTCLGQAEAEQPSSAFP